MRPHIKMPYILVGLLLIAAEIKGASIIENGRSNINLESRLLQEFSSSLHISKGENGFSHNSAMLHPYLQKLLDTLGTRQVEDIDWIFSGVTSEDCKAHVLEWVARFFTNTTDITSEEEKWALHLLDAWGKIPEGFLGGHINSMGDFHECVGIKARDIELLLDDSQPISRNFEGRYCTSYIFPRDSLGDGDGGETTENLESLLNQKEIGVKEALSIQEFIDKLLSQRGMYVVYPSIGVCMPNSCSPEDIQNILTNLLSPNPFTDGIDLPGILPVVTSCQVEKRPDFDAATIIVIILLSVITILVLTAAVTDFWFEKTDRERPTGLAFKYFMAFSLYTNTRKWRSTRKGAEDFGCLHGIRFFSTAWVVLGHTFETYMLVPPWNMFDLRNIWKNWAMLTILNGTFTVDTFFTMSGALATYSILKLLSKTNGKLNLFMFYVHRYIRLTPTYAIVVGINATLLVYLGNGPYSNFEWQQQLCRDNWWINLLYISNVYKVDTQCVGQTWYLANDMQFYILVPFIVYPIWKKEKIGLALLAIYTILSCISPILVVWYHGSAPAMIMTGNIEASFTELYFRPWPRIQTFLVGVWLGWLLYKTNGKRINLPRVAVVGLWLCSTGAACAVMFGIQPWFDNEYDVPKVPGYFYAALSRFTWAVVISWIIFACIKGYGGIVNSFLSWRAFMPLGRLSYCVYLTSMQLQEIYHRRMAQPMRYTIYTLINIYFGHLVMTHIVGFIFTLLFESPFIIIQKLIFEGDTRQPKKETKKEKIDP